MRRLALVALAAVALFLASCSSSSHTTTSGGGASVSSSSNAGPSAGGATIMISGFAYAGTMTVKPGAKVTVTNKDSVAHTLTDKAAHLFDTGNIAGDGGTGAFTAPTKPGKYQFGCTYHANMHGTLVVTG